MPTESFEIRHADWNDPRDREALTQLRVAVFVHEQGVPEDMELDEEEESATHFLASDVASGDVLGCIRLTRHGKATRLCVRANARREGVGRALLRRLVQEAQAQGMERLYLHAQTHATAFYEREGFSSEGEVFMEAGIAHRRMVRAL